MFPALFSILQFDIKNIFQNINDDNTRDYLVVTTPSDYFVFYKLSVRIANNTYLKRRWILSGILQKILQYWTSIS
jgi:retron-type reverse transcriptase